ncbi:MAG: hypothetical protein DRI57_22800 [Deltaproteobacteria bacterium]|nr:MAG: hypothetical protein DRI57_22800 [Deltaproteobacteria bacterium]
MKKDGFPRTHIGLTRRSWQRVREGLARTLENREDRERCLEWCLRFPDHTGVWAEIIKGRHREMAELAFRTEDYFDLPRDAMAWWERIIQNHPFAAIFAGERYAALLKRRKDKREQTCV